MGKVSKKWKTKAVLNDLHKPYHDQKTVGVVLDFLRDIKPDGIIAAGDITDFHEISRFRHKPVKAGAIIQTTQAEINGAHEFLKTCVEITDDVELVPGNHEHRLIAYILENAPTLAGLSRANEKNPVLGLKNLLRLDELGVKFTYSGLKESYTRVGKLLVGHFDVIRRHSGWTARALVERMGCSVMTGHCHRMGAYYKTYFDGSEVAGWENGCLCLSDAPYLQGPNWQQGFSLVHYRNDGRFMVEPIPIVKHKFFYGGKEYAPK